MLQSWIEDRKLSNKSDGNSEATEDDRRGRVMMMMQMMRAWLGLAWQFDL